MTLDPEQERAAHAPERLVKVQAGAGSGKTRTLTSRIVWLVEQGVSPAGICAITFTKKAAEELQRRLPPSTAGVQASTIDSLCYYILRAERRFRKIADEGFKRRLIRVALREQEVLDANLPAFSECVAMISTAKTMGKPFPPEVSSVATRYQELLRENNVWDFSDLVLESLAMFKNHPEIATRWAGRWSHLLIDEVQDTSALQWELIRFLVSRETNVFVVGDFQQSMYKFRGADPDTMDRLDELFDGTFTTYPLSTNYRSVGRIVAAANVVSAKMVKGALRLVEHRGAIDGSTVHRLPALTRGHDSANLIADLLKAEYARGVAWSDMAVLYRLNSNSEALEAAFSKAGVPYIVVGGMGFYGKSEVKDVLAYLKLTQGIDREAIERIYFKPARWLGKVWLKEVTEKGGFEAFINGGMRFSKAPMQRAADKFQRVLSTLLEMHDAQPIELIRHVRDVLDYEHWIVGEEPDLMDEAVIETLDALEEGASMWHSIPDFLAFAGLCQRTAGVERSLSDVVDRVALSTIHRAKGLEWPIVVVHGLSDKTFPHHRADYEEERRVLYVGVTRARDRLYFSTGGGTPSGFWTELCTTHDLAVPAPEGLPTCSDHADGEGGADRHAPDEPAAGAGPDLERDPGVCSADDGQRSSGGDAGCDLRGVSVDLAALV